MNSYVDKQLGNYRILQLLGHGGFADVYLAEHVYLNTRAAIKVLHTHLTLEDRERFHQEALLIARLTHPHIIRVLDFGMADAAPFLVMEYAPNGTLRQRIPKGTPLSPVTFLPYVQQVALALQYAHDQHIIHRDVKPENMLLDVSEEVKLSDFGIAVVSQSTLSQKTESTIIGTMAYMAPEQLQGKPRAASDQYALGVVIYEWLTGIRPFTGSYMELISQHLSTPPPPIDEVALSIPHEAALVLQRALSKDPRARFARIQDFSQALVDAFRVREPVPAAQQQEKMVASPPQPVLPIPNVPITLMAQQAPSAISTPLAATVAVPSPLEKSTTNAATVIRSSSKKVRGCARRLIGTLLVAALLLCALGFGGYNYLVNRNPSTQAPVLAKNFMTALVEHNYDQAYITLSSAFPGGISHDDFIRQAQTEDRCYGLVTGYKEIGTSSLGGTQVYIYLVSRIKLAQAYHLHLTVAKDFLGNWHITDYNSDAGLGQPACH